MTMRTGPVLRLRSHLAALLVVVMLLTFALVMAGLLAYRVPRIEHDIRRAQEHEVSEMRERMELLLQARRTRLALLEALIDHEATRAADAVLDSGVGDGSVLSIICRLSPQGRVVAVGLPQHQREQRHDLLGSDLSADPLFKALAGKPGVVWSGRYASVLNGAPAVGLALRDEHGDAMLAEVPFAALVATVQMAAGVRSSSIWVVDRDGEIVADSQGGQYVGKLNIRDWPLMRALLQGQQPVDRFQYEGTQFRATVSHSPTLDWYFIGRTPVGLANPQMRNLVGSVLAALVASLVVALLIAPFWASRMARPLHRIIERADRSTSGQGEGLAWPRGSVAEFNRLSGDLQAMTDALRERERKSQAIFHASPVPMAVADMDDDYRLVDVNQAWCTEFRYRREDVLLRTTLDIDLWVDRQARGALQLHAEQGSVIGDVWLRRCDGTTVLMKLHGRPTRLPSARLLIWAAVDVGPMRRVEQELRDLNQQLEARVRHRTEALGKSNAELLMTVEQLRAAQDELVRAAKMAALGSLVAGVAHELNTPLGNGVMAVSAMAEATQDLKEAMLAGLKRSDLQQLVESLEQGCDIATRNLTRAAELVHSFKQVAVDQTSAQRRSFELGEVVHEMVVSLRPSFARKPWRIEVQVPESGLRLDSYPGALGQVIGNLIQNALVHGFEARDHGTVRITAGRSEDGWLWLRVADDGRGIAAKHIGRIFDPFMTTRMGRGGTGLGLHISYNAVVNLLGGTLTVDSTEGQGACFDVRLPVEAPRNPTAQNVRGGVDDRETPP